MTDPRCLLADDHPALTVAVSTYLSENGFDVVGPVADGRRAVALAEQVKPELALVDFRMPRLSGVELIKALLEVSPKTRIAVYTADADEQIARDVLDAGAVGARAEGGAARRSRPRARGCARRQLVPRPRAREGRPSPDRELTQRELDVLGLLAEGLQHEEIGRRLGISSETVRTHLRKASDRLGAATRTQAVATALRLGLIA